MDLSKLRLYDNTRLSDYKRCPRFYYFRHIRDWVSIGERRAPLVFGSAWHSAMDRLWATTNQRKNRDFVIDSAFGAFIARWIKDGMRRPTRCLTVNEELLPRTPARASICSKTTRQAARVYYVVHNPRHERPSPCPQSN